MNGDLVPLNESRGMIATPTGERLVSLYPEYIKSTDSLTCPDSKLNGENLNYTNIMVAADPMYTALRSIGISDSVRSMQEYALYKASSYDFQVPHGSTNPEVHYSTIWSNDSLTTAGVDRQLRWRNPPSDTVITWCTYHRDLDSSGAPSAGSKDLVLFLDGRVKLIQSSELLNWSTAWKVSPGN